MLHASYMSKKPFLPLEEHAEVGGKRPSISSFRVRVRGRSARSPRLGLEATSSWRAAAPATCLLGSGMRRGSEQALCSRVCLLSAYWVVIFYTAWFFTLWQSWCLCYGKRDVVVKCKEEKSTYSVSILGVVMVLYVSCFYMRVCLHLKACVSADTHNL